MTEADAAVRGDPEPLAVRPAVALGVADRDHVALFDARSVAVLENAGDAAHRRGVYPATPSPVRENPARNRPGT